MLAAGLFGGTGPGANVAGRSGGQAAAVTQALAGTLPHASAAAMLAATGGQTAGGPNAGPAGDAAATAAAMMAAGLMRGWVTISHGKRGWPVHKPVLWFPFMESIFRWLRPYYDYIHVPS